MTTKPKARKFRIRRSPGSAEAMSGDAHLSDAPEAAEAPLQLGDPVQPVRPRRPAQQQDMPRTAPPRDAQPRQAAPERPQSLAERRAQTSQRLSAVEGTSPTRRPSQPETQRPAPQRPAPQQPPEPEAAPRPRRPQAQEAQPRPDPQPQAHPAPQAGQPQPGPKPAPQPHPMAGQDQAEPAPRVGDLDAIRKEGLTGRQLRMARRVAQKHGLAPTSDFDAVRLLRERGVDPFQRANMLEVLPENAQKHGTAPEAGKVQLPQTVPAGQNAHLPSPHVGPQGIAPSERRQREIMEIQRDISRRRRRRSLQLLVRLAFFVMLPTMLAGYYYYRVATPMYAATSEFLILQADATSGSPLGGLLSGTQFATNQDSIAVQSYLQSKDAMVRLDADTGFAAHFSQESIDPIQRLPADASTEATYKLYKKYVKIGYDPTEGVIKMEVAAADPQIAAVFSTQLIAYAEERVDELSRRKRDDAMKSARESLEKAKEERRAAQERLVKLQEGTVVDPEAVIGTLRTQISTYEIQLQEKELQLAALLDNARPNQARVDGVRSDITRLNELLARLNARMTEARGDGLSLAADTAQVQMAQADLATADLFLQSALQNEKQTELEANRQVRYLTTSVRPVAPQDPSYPRAFENTILVFMVLAGAYLMISLTGAILREQVSS
ncbi:capsular polysaccharide transport system permease protein [Pseudooceanicola antarcticus]|uniref:Capsular polysaccharide transport system permease protein n=2 Tax=Pseudooceanicola antarcticus TaxID=1247613 RepID=A0A285IRT7_9RHOB|nr:capsule biosynthesis protein [Pseudooceanicola antarcticus]SNY50682.1 capsular polysaccharide transport system permease protein [Pseudooceanicola antarcticus]